jgi:hypothetical protein
MGKLGSESLRELEKFGGFVMEVISGELVGARVQSRDSVLTLIKVCTGSAHDSLQFRRPLTLFSSRHALYSTPMLSLTFSSYPYLGARCFHHSKVVL